MVDDNLTLADAEANGYRVVVRRHGEELALEARDDQRILLTVGLGATVRGRALRAGAARVTQHVVQESLQLRSGKTTIAKSVRHHELRVCFEDPGASEWSLVVRMAADGVAVRYEIPDLQGVSTLDGEATSLALDTFERAWLLDYQTWYETPRFGRAIAEVATGDYGFPVLLRRDDDAHVLVTEAGIDGRFSGSHALITAPATSLRFVAADESTEVARGPLTPWRVFIFGSLADVVESTFVDELAPAQHQSIEDASWVRPGRAAWSWWSDFYSGAQLEQQKHFVDVAARLGWEHLLIDCGWEETWVPEIVSYASRFGIQVHLWTVWHDLDGPEKLDKLALWRSWGVAGIKVDFMESESKDRYRWYDSVLQETARLEMMVNFHGSVIPRGWARTWPQVIGYEAIRGSEYYVFYNDTPLTAAHNVIQPFTRNIVGGMDYTPVAFTAPGRTTSDGHELGLSVAFECGITHFADGVDAYLARPAAARFLAQLAPSWDETVLLTGTPDTEAVIARRSGDRWFIGAIATGPARVIDVPLSRLGNGPFDAWIVRDEEEGAGGLSEERSTVTGTLRVRVNEDGGFGAVLVALGSELFRTTAVDPARLPSVPSSIVELEGDGSVELSIPSADVVRVPPGWAVSPISVGRWEVRAPAELSPGGSGVITIEAGGIRGVAAISHIRVARPLAGEVQLSSLPMTAFRNESGPVERDMSNGGGNPKDGRRMTVAGRSHDVGLGMSSPAEAHFHLGGRALRLVGGVGVDDETPGGAATVSVVGDGQELLTLTVAAGDEPAAYDVDVQGRNTLVLRTAALTAEPAHIDWLAPRLLTSDPTPLQHTGR